MKAGGGRSWRLGVTVLGAAALGATMTLGVAAPASAATPSSTTTEVNKPDYTDTDVVALLVNGSGPIADANPDVAYGLGFTKGDAGLTHQTIDELTHTLFDAVPDFNSTVTQAITSGNPYRVEEGLFALEDALSEVATVVNAGDAVGYCVVVPVISIDVVLFVANAAAIENGALWRNNAFWLASAGTSQFSVQDQSALIASNV